MLVNRREKGKELERKIFKLLKLREGIKKRTKKETREERKYDAEKFAGRVSRAGQVEIKENNSITKYGQKGKWRNQMIYEILG